MGKLPPSQVPEGSGTGARFINTLSLPWPVVSDSRVSHRASALHSLGQESRVVGHPQPWGGSAAEAAVDAS